MQEESDVFNCTYYRLNKTLLSMIGYWPYQTKFASLAGYSVQLSLFIILILEFLGILRVWEDIDLMIEWFTAFIVVLVAFTLSSTWTLKRAKMKELLDYIKDDWKHWIPRPEVNILQKYAMRGRLLTLAYATYIYSSALAFINLPMIPIILDWIQPLNESRPKKPLYIVEYFVDQEKYFHYILAQQYTTSITCTSMIVIVETMYMVYIQHACGIFAIIGYKLQHIVQTKNTNEDFDDKRQNASRTNVDQEIIQCILNHTKVIKFVDEINNAFSMGFFIIMGLNMLSISATGVQTVLKLGQIREVLRYGVFTVSQMFHLFFLSVPGQFLIDHSISICDCIYDSNWYELPVRSQKLLLFVMRRSLKPCEFTAGTLFTFSMENFASILRASMSYFTVLSSVR